MYLRDLSQFHIVPLLLLPDIQAIFAVGRDFKPAGKSTLASGGSGLEVLQPLVGKRIRPCQLNPTCELYLCVSRVVRIETRTETERKFHTLYLL